MRQVLVGKHGVATRFGQNLRRQNCMCRGRRHKRQVGVPLLGGERVGFAAVDVLSHVRMIGHLQLLQIGRVEHFAPTTGEDCLRRRIKKLPSEHQHVVVEERLVNRGKSAVVKRTVEIDPFYLSSDRTSQTFDRNLRLRSSPSLCTLGAGPARGLDGPERKAWNQIGKLSS